MTNIFAFSLNLLSFLWPKGSRNELRNMRNSGTLQYDVNVRKDVQLADFLSDWLVSRSLF